MGNLLCDMRGILIEVSIVGIPLCNGENWSIIPPQAFSEYFQNKKIQITSETLHIVTCLVQLFTKFEIVKLFTL